MTKSVHTKWVLWSCLGVAALWYFTLYTNFDFDIFGPEALWHVYNQTLQRLVAGRFDMDEAVLRGEGYVHAGKLVSYFGIFPALLRLPFLPLINFDTVPLSRLSCLAGLIVCGALQLRMLWIAHTFLPENERQRSLLYIFAVALLFTGAQLTLTFAAWVFNEPIIWGAAAVLAFYTVVLGRLTKPAFTSRDMCLMAGAVVVAFLCRPTAGFALLLTFIALFAWELWKVRSRGSSHLRDSGVRLFLVPLLILVAGGLLTAWVNYERFGNPLTFVNLLEKERILADARRLHVERDLHPFEPVRLLPSFAYYFFGLPIARLWPQLTAAYYDDIGWPRSILLAKETLLIASAVIGFIALVKRVRADGPWVPVIITGTGALIYILIMLGLPIINYRYQMDLQPEISFFAVLGYISLSRFVAAHTMRLPALICAVLLAANIGISHLDLLQAKFSSFALGATSRERVYKMTYPVSALFANAE